MHSYILNSTNYLDNYKHHNSVTMVLKAVTKQEQLKCELVLVLHTGARKQS